MTSSRNGPRRLAAIAALFALALAVAPAASGGEQTALRVQMVRVDGDRLWISVANPGEEIAYERLVIRVALDSGVLETTLLVSIPGGQTKLFELHSPAPGEEMTPLGVILDDGSPF